MVNDGLDGQLTFRISGFTGEDEDELEALDPERDLASALADRSDEDEARALLGNESFGIEEVAPESCADARDDLVAARRRRKRVLSSRL